MLNTDKAAIKESVLSSIRQGSEFPSLANTINFINRVDPTKETSISELANIILKDYALTSRVLKVVNSVSYAQFGEVTTISRGIIILGFENIKNIALTLLLFQHLQKNGSGSDVIDTIVKSLHSGITAQKIARDTNFVDEEEAFICSLFHTFGKMLASFVLHDKMNEIKQFSMEKNVSESVASMSVLGMSYEEIGMTIAKEWHFPNKIVQCMKKISSSEITDKSSEIERLKSISSFSNELSNILSGTEHKEDKEKKLEKLLDSYKIHFGTFGGEINKIVDFSMQELGEYSKIYNIKIEDTSFNKQLTAWLTGEDIEEKETVITERQGASLLDSLETITIIEEDEKIDTTETIFTKGIQDMNNAILNNYSLNDIIRIVIEIIYRGLQSSMVSRVLFLLKDTVSPEMHVRFGLGDSIDALKIWFRIPLDVSNDIFNAVITTQKDLIIKDIDAQDIKAVLPQWYKNRVSPSMFVILLPIIVNKKTIGLFYIEGDKKLFQNISGAHLNYLRILRDQTVLSIKQK